jgi:hypothetical protein
VIFAGENTGNYHTSTLPKLYPVNWAWQLLTKWGKEIVSSVPTITVSDSIAEELRNMGQSKKVFVVPNYPTFTEIKDLTKPLAHNKLSSGYAGIGPPRGFKSAHRNTEGLIERFNIGDIGEPTFIGTYDISTDNVKYKGFLSRQDMYKLPNLRVLFIDFSVCYPFC